MAVDQFETTGWVRRQAEALDRFIDYERSWEDGPGATEVSCDPNGNHAQVAMSDLSFPG